MSNDIASREAGPLLEPGERPASSGKRWAILVAFAAVMFLGVASISHKGNDPAPPPAATTATGPTPAAPVTPPATPQSGG